MRSCSSVVRVYFKKFYKKLKIYEQKLIQKELTNYIKLSTFNRNIYRGYYTVARRYELYVLVARTISHD